MLRGEFIRGDGLVLPNNITFLGAGLILKAAFQNVAPNLHMALGKCNPRPDLALEDLNEPTIGVNGYARQTIGRDDTDWLTDGSLNGEFFLETRPFVFVPTGDGFDKQITRPVIVNHATLTEGELVVAVGSALPEAVTLLATTPEIERTFKYRIYAR